MKIVMYTKAGCVNCTTAKQLLKSKGLQYEPFDVEADPHILSALLIHHPEARQMPQVFIDGQRVGGLAGLQAALKQLGV